MISKPSHLINNCHLSRSHCECDELFYRCLKAVEPTNPKAGDIGNLFFNVLSLQCAKDTRTNPCQNATQPCTGRGTLKLEFRMPKERF